MTAMEMMARQRTPEETARAYRAFMEETLPMRTAVARFIASEPYMPVWVIHPDGSPPELVTPPVSAASTSLLATLENYMREVARRHGLEMVD